MPAVLFEKVSKRYRLGAPMGSLRDALPSLVGRFSRRMPGHRTSPRYVWALRDVDLQVEPGEAFGIIGPNGAGKTTILKLLSRVSTPTSGRVEVTGRVAALIELGAGFHPDLTGRENVYLYGSIMGLRRKEIDRKFDAIVDFAELADFIDTPFKHYSSGMQVRLGFSVIAHIDCDVLLVDEVLAVGDMAFRKKCQERMGRFRDAGKTIVFVSHNIYAIQALCERTMYLHRGRVQAMGPTRQVVSKYIDDTNKTMLAAKPGGAPGRWGTGEVRITGVELLDGQSRPAQTLRTGDRLQIVMEYQADTRIPKPNFQFIVSAPGGVQLICASSAAAGYVPAWIEGPGRVVCAFDAIPLLPRAYSVLANICSLDRRTDYDTLPDAARFSVTTPQDTGELPTDLPVGESALVEVPFTMHSG